MQKPDNVILMKISACDVGTEKGQCLLV